MDQFPPADELVLLHTLDEAIAMMADMRAAELRRERDMRQRLFMAEHAQAATLNDLALEQAKRAYRERLEKVPF